MVPPYQDGPQAHLHGTQQFLCENYIEDLTCKSLLYINSKVVDKYFLNIYLSIYFSHRCRLGKNNFNSLHTIVIVAIPILASAILFCDFLLGLRGYLDLFSQLCDMSHFSGVLQVSFFFSFSLLAFSTSSGSRSPHFVRCRMHL